MDSVKKKTGKWVWKCITRGAALDGKQHFMLCAQTSRNTDKKQIFGEVETHLKKYSVS